MRTIRKILLISSILLSTLACLFVKTNEAQFFYVGNVSAVYNGPSVPTTFTYNYLAKYCRLEKITTYHWNNGQGVQPGTISLKASDGTVYGPWEAKGEEGQGGVPNAYWVVKVDVLLQDKMTYTVVDSDPGTMAQNEGTGGMGMAWGDGRCSDEGDF